MTLSRRNNILAGIFLIAGVLLAVALSVVLSDIRERLVPTNDYHIRFGLIQGAAGLVPGSEVQIGGRVAGRVTSVEFAFTDPAEPKRPTAIDVSIELPTSIQLYEDAVATLVQPLIGTMSAINIIDLGTGANVEAPQGAGAALEQGETLIGQIAPPSFLAQAGYGPEQAQSVRNMIKRAEDLVERINELVEETDAQLQPAFEDVNASLEDIRAIAADLREREPQWADSVDRTLARIDEAASQANDAMGEIRTGVDEANAFIADARAAVSDNRPKIDKIIDDVDSITGRLDTESVGLLNEALTSTNEGAERFAAFIDDVSELRAELAPEFRRGMANIRLASDQLKLTMVEVRRNPWRLLYRPDAKESRTEILYDAARSYAASVSDLRAASESLEAATASKGPESERIAELMQELQKAFDRYGQTEQNLLDLLAND